MNLVDVHCHLESAELSPNAGDYVTAAVRTGVVKMLTASVSPGQWDASRSLGLAHAEVAFAWGMHPWYLDSCDETDLARLAGARAAGASAVGEIGIDKQVASPSFDRQQRFFDAQLGVAREIDLPAVIHCRGAFGELLRTLKRDGGPKRGGIVHNFSGSAELALALRAYGFAVSLGGALTYRNSRKKREVLRACYPDWLVLETDSPDIPPVERRGEVNVPANLPFVLRAAAELLSEPEEAVAAATTRTASRIFDWRF